MPSPSCRYYHCHRVVLGAWTLIWEFWGLFWCGRLGWGPTTPRVQSHHEHGGRAPVVHGQRAALPHALMHSPSAVFVQDSAAFTKNVNQFVGGGWHKPKCLDSLLRLTKQSVVEVRGCHRSLKQGGRVGHCTLIQDSHMQMYVAILAQGASEIFGGT